MSGLRRWLRLLGAQRLIACLGALTLLIVLEWMVLNNEQMLLDQIVLDRLSTDVPAGIGRALIVVYQVSGTRFTAMLVLAALIFLVLKRAWNDVSWLAISTGGILFIVDRWLKPHFDRARPLDRLVDVDGRSFPSGHAAGGVVFYFLMCAILSERYPRLRRPLYVGSALWVGLIWLSSLYCRVHWFTDIAAGAAVGFIWLTLCQVSLRYTAHRDHPTPGCCPPP